jgi:hypothetical protein
MFVVREKALITEGKHEWRTIFLRTALTGLRYFGSGGRTAAFHAFMIEGSQAS